MIFTLGHSTLSVADFIAASKGRVTTIVDIRSHPTSKWEWFWKEKMERWLPDVGLTYEWWPELGGWTKRHLALADEMRSHGVDLEAYARGKFPKQRIGKRLDPPPDDTQLLLPGMKPSWTNQGLHDFQFFLSTPEAVDGVRRLMARGRRENVAIVCSEAQWWRCHRSMISDALAFAGVDSLHVMPVFRQKNLVKFVAGTKTTSHASVIGNRLERYEPEVMMAWETGLPRV